MQAQVLLGEQFFDRLGLQHTHAQLFELRSRACGEPFFSSLRYGAEPLLDQAACHGQCFLVDALFKATLELGPAAASFSASSRRPART